MRWPDVFLVNGPSSAGKSTLCRGLQSAIESSSLVVGFDDFIFMSAPRYYRGADSALQGAFDAYTALGAEMIVTSRPGEPVSVTARFGPVLHSSPVCDLRVCGNLNGYGNWPTSTPPA